MIKGKQMILEQAGPQRKRPPLGGLDRCIS